MPKSLNVLFVTPEVFPFAKESGISDVSHSLTLALRELGHDVRVMLPKYGCISERKNKIHEIKRLNEIPINLEKGVQEIATIKSSSISNNKAKVQAYIATNVNFFDSKKGVYHDPLTWEPYPDNDDRFIFFNKSVIETCLLLGWIPDIIHCNEWYSGLLPALIRELYPKEFKKTKFVFTIHNFHHQGEFPLTTFAKTGLPDKVINNFKHKNLINFTKAGLIYADYITTVSPTYAKEALSDKQYTKGLNTILKTREDVFKGILNRIDYTTWNPVKDDCIKSKLGSDVEEFKYNNKVELLKQFGFELDPQKPLLAMIPRIGFQKGIPLLLEIADELFKHDIHFAILGQGKNELKEKLNELAEKYPDKLKIKYAFDNQLSHLIEAGADMFLMPSQFEPCGLNLMYSLAYGTVPIVRLTGGMKDIATQFNEKTQKGNSFTFNKYLGSEFLDAIKQALKTYENKEIWSKIIENGMNQDYSWKETVSEYDEIYRFLIKE
jgi:starch synthase